MKDHIDSGKEEDLSYLIPAIATDIVFFIKNTEKSAIASLGGFGKLSQDIINYLNSHYTENTDLETLSDAFHMSISSICHVFKEDFGITIKQYVMQKRLNTARFMLSRGKRSEEVCRQVGFFNYFSFFRAYKKQFGFSPSNTNS